MRCSICREAISARLDGEDPGVPAEAVDAHLGGCADCAAWAGEAAALAGAVGSTPRDPVPLPPAVLATLTAPPAPERRRGGLLATGERRGQRGVLCAAPRVWCWPP